MASCLSPVVNKHLLGITVNHDEPALRLCTLPRDTCPAARQQQRPTSPEGLLYLHSPTEPVDIKGQTLSQWLRHLPQHFGYALLYSGRHVSPAARWCGVFRCTKSTKFNKAMTWALSAALISSRLSPGLCLVHTNDLFSSFQAMGTVPVCCLLSHSSLRVLGQHPGDLGGFGGLQVIPRTRGKNGNYHFFRRLCTGFVISKILLFFFFPVSVQALFHKFSAASGWDRMPFMLAIRCYGAGSLPFSQPHTKCRASRQGKINLKREKVVLF